MYEGMMVKCFQFPQMILRATNDLDVTGFDARVIPQNLGKDNTMELKTKIAKILKQPQRVVCQLQTLVILWGNYAN